MSRYVFKMPDLGEGTVEAELVALHVKPGDVVQEDQIMAEVMTEKAAVEVPAPVSGRVVSISAKPGDMVPVGSELVVFDTDASGESANSPATAPAPSEQKAAPAPAPGESRPAPAKAASSAAPAVAANVAPPHASSERVMASPATRRRAREAGIDLRLVKGSGPGGRIVRADLDHTIQATGAAPSAARVPAGMARREGMEEIKVIGLRRTIAQRMSAAKREIPHFSYVEEVDVTELESLRRHLNARRAPGTAAYTYLPFLVTALTRVLVGLPPVQRSLRRRARCDPAPPAGARRHRHADTRWLAGAGGAPCRSPRATASSRTRSGA